MTLLLITLLMHGPGNEALTVQILSNGQFHERLGAVHQLNAQLSPQQIARLCQYLQQPGEQLGDAVLKNDLINTLRAQDQAAHELVPALLTIYNNPKHGELMRDYAVQHLTECYGWSREKDAILTALNQATGETGSSIAGTALLGLERIGDQTVRDKTAAQALNAAMQTTASELTRIAAVRICGRLSHQPALSLVRDMVQNEGNISLRMAAIATLGELGDSTDLPLLLDLKNGLDSARLIPAAQRAVQLIENAHGRKIL